jgi:hypothetical protein
MEFPFPPKNFDQIDQIGMLQILGNGGECFKMLSRSEIIAKVYDHSNGKEILFK